ncbi:uncharacterized protein LOC121411775 [Lytechinus variegatus]|uniref:uncharacterized protein LOC121411775 n=1 Tax=Lytechinus variegatus TaxID=7654 RepID=UPI001BB1447F|nr:uncharacterized protein LOC121411775 [Lytechinus variegatus]
MEMASAAQVQDHEDYDKSLVDELRDVVVKCRWQFLGHRREFQGKRCTRIFSKDGEDVVLVYLPPDRFYAMDVSCPHAGGPLDMGDIEEIGGHTCLVCPWHDYDFRLDNGESTSGLKQPVHSVKVVDDLVYINCRAELIPLDESDSSTKDCEQPTSQESSEASLVEKTEFNGASLCEFAVRILNEPNAKQKVHLTRETHQRWKGGDIAEVGSCEPPPMPLRDKSLNILQPGKIKRGKGGTLASRIAVLHSLANIEQWAIDLSWDIIARFSDAELGDGSRLPREFFTDFAKVADDEAKHFTLLESRIESLGSKFGALPVHNGLWQSAEETNDSLLGRLAVVHMVHEARGLDVHPKTQERFRRQSDAESVEILDTIYNDEITHVAAGLKWFTYVCRHSYPPIDCIPKFHELVRTHFRGHLKPPFNEEGRETAGMSKEWYLPLVKT